MGKGDKFWSPHFLDQSCAHADGHATAARFDSFDSVSQAFISQMTTTRIVLTVWAGALKRISVVQIH